MANATIKRALLSVLLLGMVFAVGTPAEAETQQFSLQDLIDNEDSIQIDDKLFSNFRYESDGDFASASDVTVSSAEFGVGLRFSGFFLDSPADGASHAKLSYDVTVLDENRFIKSAQMFGDPELFGDDGGLVKVLETFSNNGETLPEDLTIFAKPDEVQRADSVDFDSQGFIPLKTLHVYKDIKAKGDDTWVGLSFIEQTFVQVPEPTSLALMLTACCGAALVVRRLRERT